MLSRDEIADCIIKHCIFKHVTLLIEIIMKVIVTVLMNKQELRI